MCMSFPSCRPRRHISADVSHASRTGSLAPQHRTTTLNLALTAFNCLVLLPAAGPVTRRGTACPRGRLGPRAGV